MKTRIKIAMIFTFILVSTITFAKPRITNYNHPGYTAIFQSVLSLVSKDLNLDTTNLNINMVRFDEKANRTYLAIAEKISKTSYKISMWDFYREDLIRILIHELVHVQQFNEGRLILTNTYLSFDGVVITTKTPYGERTYEMEADQTAKELYLKYKEEFKGDVPE